VTTTTISAGAHFAEFCSAYCRHTKGRWAGEPLELEPWQREFVDEALRLDPKTGKRVYRQVLLGVPRKNGKSTLAASLALYMAGADGEPGAEVVIAAGSRDQADVVYRQAREFVEASPTLSDFYDAQRFTITCPDGVIRKIAADGRLQHGLNPSAIVCDELHAFMTPRQEELWAALTTGSGAREEPLICAITTAGYDKATVLGRLFDEAMRLPEVERRAGLTIARDVDSGFLCWWYGVDPDAPLDDVSSWLEANPASWITEEELVRQFRSPTVDEYAFRRLHLNQWTKTRESWLPPGLWSSLRDSDVEFEEGDEIVVGVDVGLVHDSTAVAIAKRLDDGRVLVSARVWAARDDAVAHTILPGGRVDLEIVENYIRDLAARYVVREVVYDPRFFDRSAEILSNDGLLLAPVEQSSRRMLEAYAAFYLATGERRVAHDGDAVLSSHVEATNATMTDRGWKISRQRKQRIDAAVAVVMAHYRAEKYETASYLLSWDEVENDSA
jgi:phage terminase large subunit-like protein